MASPVLPPVGQAAAQVEHVLDEGEPDPGQACVDDAVDDAVELAPPQQQDEQDGGPFSASSTTGATTSTSPSGPAGVGKEPAVTQC